MGWLSDWRGSRRSAENVIGNDGTVNDVLLRALLSNEPIDRDKAMMLPAVSGAVDFITSAVACMPVRLYRTKKGVVEEVENDQRTKLLNGDTGDTRAPRTCGDDPTPALIARWTAVCSPHMRG